MDELLKTSLNAGAFGLVAWLVYYTFQKTIPNLLETSRVEIREQRRAASEDLRRLEQAVLSKLQHLAQIVEHLGTILVFHDATMRGNGAIVCSMDDLLKVVKGETTMAAVLEKAEVERSQAAAPRKRKGAG